MLVFSLKSFAMSFAIANLTLTLRCSLSVMFQFLRFVFSSMKSFFQSEQFPLFLFLKVFFTVEEYHLLDDD